MEIWSDVIMSTSADNMYDQHVNDEQYMMTNDKWQIHTSVLEKDVQGMD